LRGDYRIGDWLVHPRMNSMERNGDTVHFEPKVMQVLLTLATEPGEVVTREHLRKAVWPDVFVGEDVLIRAISELRRAFSDDPREPHTIQTIPKVGYRLLATVTPPARDIAEESERNHHHKGSALASAPAPIPNPQEASSAMAPPASETRPESASMVCSCRRHPSGFGSRSPWISLASLWPPFCRLEPAHWKLREPAAHHISRI